MTVQQPAGGDNSQTVSEATGRVEDTSVFDEPGDILEDGASTEHNEEGTEQPTETQTPTETPKDGEEGEEKGEAKVTPEAPKVEEPKLLAGKYKTRQDLANAFIQLGGDPANYDTDEKLVEAYQVRQQEYNRSRQDFDKKQEQTQVQQPSVEEKAAKLLENLDWNKIENAKDLVQEMAKAIVSNPDLFKNGENPDPEQMAAELAPRIQARERAQKELSELETEVPRLQKVNDPQGRPLPNPFRDAFAVYVQGQKQMGNYTNLKDAMKSFMQANAGAVEDGMKQKEAENALKAGASATNAIEGASDGSVETSKSPEDDILEGILDAASSRHKKFM